MSLHALANHMASKGRGGDSMLVHMSKDEVAALQALAERHGKTLTINPETGQPEAFSLKSLLPMIAGAALNFFVPGLGAAVGSAFGVGAAAGTGIAVGGITSLATGSLSRGLMAGLGAYGGASLAGGLEAAGANSLADKAAGSAYGATSGMTDAAAQELGFASAEEAAQNAAAQAAKSFDPTAVSAADKMGAGFSAVTQSPSTAAEFAKANWKPLAAAAVPVMADAMVPTTTKAPDYDTGNIRKFSYDPYGQTYTPLGIYPAKGYTGYADGGIVALADGGTGPQPGSEEYNKMVGNWFAQYPTATSADIQNASNAYGLNPEDVRKAMQASGLSAAAQYSAFHPDVGVPDTPQGGLAGLNSNVQDWVSKAQANTQLSNEQKRQMAYDAMNQYGYNQADILRATGKTVEDLFPKAAPTYGSAPATGIDYQGRVTDITTPGDKMVNTDGSVTTQPNIPGRPYGGFTGMDQVKSAYTAGGGSLGYVPYAPKTIEEFNTKYTNTGGSQQAYDFLMGKGAADVRKPVTPTGELMLPYKEAVMGIPAAAGRPTQKYIFDQATRTYKLNPDYQPLSYDSTGKRIVGASTNQLNTAIGKGDAAIQALVDAGSVDYPALAAMLGITVADAQKRFPKKEADKSFSKAFTEFIGGGGGEGSGAASASSAAAAAASASGEGDGAGAGVGDGSTIARGGYIDRSKVKRMALGGLGALAGGGQAQYNLGSYSDGGRLLKGPGDGVSDSIPATIGQGQPARLADGEFVVPARIVSELGNGSTEAGARKLYAMMDRVQKARGKTTGKGKVAKNTNAAKYLPA